MNSFSFTIGILTSLQQERSLLCQYIFSPKLHKGSLLSPHVWIVTLIQLEVDFLRVSILTFHLGNTQGLAFNHVAFHVTLSTLSS